MKINYTVVQQFIARLILIGLCLQSCSGGLDNHPLIPIEEKQPVHITTHAQATILLTNIQPLADQVLTAQGGHAVTFYEEAGELRASVEIVDEKDKFYNGVPVVLEKETDVASLSHLPKKIQQRRIQVQFSSEGRPTKIAVHKPWIMGGSDSKKGNIEDKLRDEEAEEAESKIGIEESNQFVMDAVKEGKEIASQSCVNSISSQVNKLSIDSHTKLQKGVAENLGIAN